MDYIDIVCDKIPGPDGCTFIETENSSGASISVGEWIEREDGLAVLRIFRCPADGGVITKKGFTHV